MMMKFKRLSCAVVIGASCIVAPAWAAPAISAITSSQQSGSDVIRIEFSEPLAAIPSGFVVQSPPRLAIDLSGVTNAIGRNLVEVNQGNVRSVNVAQSGDRTRLVVSLRKAVTYQASLVGNALLLSLNPAQVVPPIAIDAEPAAVASPVRETVTHFADNQNLYSADLKDIDFRRGQDGSGRVVVELPNNQVGVDIKQQGKSLVVEFAKTTLPERLRKRFDTTDFGTPVQGMTASQSGDRVKLVIDPKGDWEHSAYQSDTQFVLEVRPVKAEPNKLSPGSGYSGEKLSLNFQNIEVRALLQVIADFTNFNVVTSDSVTGSVTLRLKDVPWDQALDIIMQAKNLGVRKNGNVLWIAPKDEINAKEKIELEAQAKLAELEPLRTQGFQLNYVKAEAIAKGLLGQDLNGSSSNNSNSSATKMLSPRGSVIYETRTNQLFVSDIPSKLEDIQKLIAQIDVPVRQVMIEARIVEADDTFGRSLGAKLGAVDLRGLNGGTPGFNVGGNNQIAVTGTYAGVGEQTLQAKVSEDNSYIPNTYFLNLPAAAQNGFNPASIALSLFGSKSNRFLNLELSALEADGRGRIVSSPRVITADQIEALIEQGVELPYLQASASGATSVSFRKANLALRVIPQITPEGSILLDVDVNKDSRSSILTPAGYAIDTKHVKTQVLVENGGTVVIGGIYIQEDRTAEQKVPFLGDIPVLGNLFKNTSKSTSKSELLIFLTPKVVSEKGALR